MTKHWRERALPQPRRDAAEDQVHPGQELRLVVEISGTRVTGRRAELAPPKVLDIKSVVEDLGGEERREDTNTDVKFALQAEVLFGKDSAKLNPEARGRIQAIAEEAQAQQANKVRVFGFTDDLGSYEHGKKLSKNRADAVHEELVKTLGPNVTYEVRGYSEDYPIADNSTEAGRMKNRRVEVSFPRGAAAPQTQESGDPAVS
ncbi:OmpA family protein [Streptomyces albidoflavus]|uniref:OmpA family protein n=1 Tax=Streptomyces albidoflavus TaxID=1886 RepID=UPI003CCA1B5F